METENQLVKVEHLYKEFDAETKVLSDINLTIIKMKSLRFSDHPGNW